MDLNVNSQVKVKLTKFGLEALKKWQNETFGCCVIDVDDNGYYETQMYKLMRIFGGYMKFGSTDMVFEDNNIII